MTNPDSTPIDAGMSVADLDAIRIRRAAASLCGTMETRPVLADVDALLAEVAYLSRRLAETSDALARSWAERDVAEARAEELLADRNRARGIAVALEQQTAAVTELHWPVEYAPDRPDICYTCCTNQAEDLREGYKTCTVEKHRHTPGGPICPTIAALDGGT